MDRVKTIVKVSKQGIIVNIVLTIVKSAIGLLANSIAVVLDAVNNLSDAISQVITIVGIKLSAKKPDKKHPYGYGRIEYLSSAILAIIILVTGITAMKESIEKIITPSDADYTYISFIVIIISIIVKFVFGKYVKKIGEKIESTALVAVGTDSYFDSIITSSTLVGALASKFYGLNLEGILGVIFSIFILKSGIEILMETLNKIIGARIDRELSKSLKDKINSYDEVKGVYDLILHNYGPVTTIGSAHIEVDADMKAKEIHKLTREITTDIFNEFDIILTIGIYASNTKDTEFMKIKNTISTVLKEYPEILQMHGLYIDSNNKMISFDIVVDFKQKNPIEIKNQIQDKLINAYSDYRFDIIIDNDFSD